MNVTPLRPLEGRAEALRDHFSEALIEEAITDGVLHRATVAMGWYSFQGGHVEPPPQFARWLGLRTIEFEVRVLLVLASELRDGRPPNADDVRRARVAEARLGAARAGVLEVMRRLAAEVRHT